MIQRGAQVVADLPEVIITTPLGQLHFDSERLPQCGGVKDFALRPISHDAALANEDDAVDFGDDVGEMMGHKQDADSHALELPNCLGEFVLAEEAEAGGGFVGQRGAGSAQSAPGSASTCFALANVPSSSPVSA